MMNLANVRSGVTSEPTPGLTTREMTRTVRSTSSNRNPIVTGRPFPQNEIDLRRVSHVLDPVSVFCYAEVLIRWFVAASRGHSNPIVAVGDGVSGGLVAGGA